MSHKYVKSEDVIGIRKVKWDELWHILYKYMGKDTYDRVDKKTALELINKA
jgi:hypothetical protein